MTVKEGSLHPGDGTIRVEAPVALPGGYVIDVEQNGQIFSVAIPEGGVAQGETFEAEMPLPQPIAPPTIDEDVVVIPEDCVIPMPVQSPPGMQSGTPVSTSTKYVVTNPDGTQTSTEETVYLDGTVVKTTISKSLANTIDSSEQQTNDQPTEIAFADVPKGAWRNQICECCDTGMCWMVMCCSFIPLGQIMQRMKLNFNADQGNYKMTCYIWTGLWMVVLSCWIMALCPTPYTLIPFIALFIYAIYALIKTRHYMRKRYNIMTCCSKENGDCDGCCNDCCCVLWCMPCVICQMMKHTHDHYKYVYKWNSTTGLPSSAPEV